MKITIRSNMENKKILISLTTTRGSDWREKIKEASKYNIKEISLFLTGLSLSERKELYALLKKTPIKNIPHVHLKTDMDVNELDYLTEKYHTQFFNLHPERAFPIICDYYRYSSRIFIENLPEAIPTNEELEKYGGICIDFSHWEERKFWEKKDPEYKKFKNKLIKYKVGCCHISAIKNFFGFIKISDHKMSALKELDYMKKYLAYLPEFISLEMENSFKEQLEAKKYLEKIIDNR